MNRRIDVRELEKKTALMDALYSAKDGEMIDIYDGDTPLATLQPSDPDAVRWHRANPGRPQDVPLPPPLKTSVDIVDLLREDRDTR
jgi:antitoxin (DNA-binding transcriptional repressor) of toxin-antitoxin stability system